MKYEFVKQKDITDCGIACLKMIAQTYGVFLRTSKVRKITKTDKSGTTLLGLKKGAEYFGFYAKTVRGDKEAFETEFTLPAIAHTVMDGNYAHYVVIYEKNENTVVIGDPADKLKTVNKNQFLQRWTGNLVLITPSDRVQKNHKNYHPFLKFIKLIPQYKKLILGITISSLVIIALGIGTSFYYVKVIDNILPKSDIMLLNIISISVVAMYLFKGAIEYLKEITSVKINRLLDEKMMGEYFKHVMKLPMEFFSNRKTGEIVARFTDIIKIREALVKLSIILFADIIMVLVCSVVLIQLNPKLILIAFGGILFYGIVVFTFNAPIKSNSKKQLEDNAEFNSYLVESINSIETTKTYTFEDRRVNGMQNIIKNYLLSSASGGNLSVSEATIINTINAITQVCIFWLGTMAVIGGKLSIGELVTFNSVIIYFMDPIKNLIQLQPEISNGIVAAERLAEFMETEAENDLASNVLDTDNSMQHIFDGDIEVRNVVFRYGMRKKVLDGISLNITHGECNAFVGESGSGKSTLAKLLIKLYEYEDGEIEISHKSISEIDNTLVRKNIAYVSQDNFLFSGTIKDNIMVGNEGCSEEDFRQTCQKFMVDDFVSKLPQGYETVVGEKGATLSGGQRQKIALARAVLKKASILILDEATSNMDLLSEKKIMDEIYSLHNVTRIIIAHRLTTITKCNKILVFQNGKISECGNHKELLSANGGYHKMWENIRLE